MLFTHTEQCVLTLVFLTDKMMYWARCLQAGPRLYLLEFDSKSVFVRDKMLARSVLDKKRVLTREISGKLYC